MKLRKIITLLLSAVAVVTLAGLFNVSNAASGDKWFNAMSIYRDKYTYKADGKTIWRLYESSASSNTPKNEGQTIFCLHRGVGLGSDFGSGTPERVNYNRYFDFKSSEMLNELQKALPDLTEHDYKRLIWIFDHAYVAPKDTSEEANAHAYKEVLLKNAGIKDSILAEAGTNYVAGSGAQIYEIDFTNEEIDDIIDVVQQMAVWNVVGDYLDSNNLEIHRAEKGSLTYKDFTEDSSILERLGDVYAARQFGSSLNSEITKLYNYFVDESEKQADSYDVHSNSQNITFQDTAAKVSISGSNYIVGPFELEKESNLDYTLNLKVTNNGNNLTNYTLLNSNKQPVSSETTIKDLVGQEFYISIPDTTDLSLVRLTVEGTYYGTVITYWTVGGSEDSEQPIAVLEKGENNFEDWTEVVYKQTEGKALDLSLRKFIIKVNDKEIATNGKFIREPNVDISPLFNKTSTTASYRHNKAPILVEIGDIVTYTIRVYNEGDIDGYVREITDYLPAQLEYLPDDKLNKQYGWQVVNNGRALKTDITSPDTEYAADQEALYGSRENKTLLKAYGGKTNDKLDYIEVQVRCKVKKDIDITQKITNIADVTEDSDENNKPVEDRDSNEDNVKLPSDEELPGYKDNEINSENKYIPGQEDDDDFEKLIIEESVPRFDLALRKFITGVNGTQIDTRVPVFTVTEDGKYVYEHTKEPVDVKTGDVVTYTLRIFNEGNRAGYAELVKDDIPEGLVFLPENKTNIDHRWKMYKEDGTETDNPKEADYIETDYLSKAQEEETGRVTLLKAFNPETMTQPDYHDIKVAFEVTEPNTSDRIIINHAQISEDSDENGKPVEDDDSVPNEWNEGEDDQDIEKIKVKYYDLALRKWVTESIVTYDGKTTVTKTGNTAEMDPEPPAKVEIRGSRLSKTTVKFKFKIRVTNEGEVAGHVGEISDYIPKGLKFIQADNPKWKEVNGKVVTDQLKDTLLQPGDSAEVEIILTWVNSEENLGLMTNIAEISKDDGDDIDSTPDNKKDGEDDQDDAPVILSITTGAADVYGYIGLAAGVLLIISGGIILIKKYVI